LRTPGPASASSEGGPWRNRSTRDEPASLRLTSVPESSARTPRPSAAPPAPPSAPVETRRRPVDQGAFFVSTGALQGLEREPAADRIGRKSRTLGGRRRERRSLIGRVPPSARSQFLKGFRLSAGVPFFLKMARVAHLRFAYCSEAHMLVIQVGLVSPIPSTARTDTPVPAPLSPRTRVGRRGGRTAQSRLSLSDLREAISMEKRDFTSDLSSLS
jgi:hypothetical protein